MINAHPQHEISHLLTSTTMKKYKIGYQDGKMLIHVKDYEINAWGRPEITQYDNGDYLTWEGAEKLLALLTAKNPTVNFLVFEISAGE